MALGKGTKLGPYEILSPLGAGGLGEVYLANDSMPDRKVAITVLSGVFSRDPHRVRRFQQKAKALASLNQPNIAGVSFVVPTFVWFLVALLASVRPADVGAGEG